MRLPTSLQWRLSIGLAVGITVFWIAAATLSGLSVRKEMDEVFDSALEETGQRILTLAVQDILVREEEGVFQRVAELRTHEELLTYVVRDIAGNVLLSSHDAVISTFPESSEQKFVTTKTHRIYFDSALQGNIKISIADPLSHRQEAIIEAVRALLIPLLVLVPVSLLGMVFLVRITVRPIQAFTLEIENRNSGDLTPVKTGLLPREIAPTAVAVNQLLGRLRKALESERTFTANSAHELRTPVAAALAQAQRLISEAPDQSTIDRATQIEAALIRLSSLSEKLMQLAKSEGASLVSEQAKDIVPILKLVISDFQRSDPDKQLFLLDIFEEPVFTTLDVDAFAILVRNLIENALTHRKDGATVHVSLSKDGELRVSNDCDPIAEETLEDLKKPFVRGETKGSGTGLGLAIINAITTGSGCQLNLRSPIKGRKSGLEVSVILAR